MRKSLMVLAAWGLIVVLCGCQQTEVAKVTYAQIAETVTALNDNATAQEIADILIYIGSVHVVEQDFTQVEEIEKALLVRLRAKVKDEVLDLHDRALLAYTYREGYALAWDAGAVLALYPLSDDPPILNEVEELSFKQNEVMQRLKLIRQQRYNYWASQQAEKALNEIRENGKDGTDDAIRYLQVIEPTLLESSVASLYDYCVKEIMDKLKKDEKATLAGDLTNRYYVTRRSLGDF